MSERLSVSNLFAEVISLFSGIEDRGKYIQETLVPEMNRLLGKTDFQSREDIVRKLFSIDPNKPGELVEILNEIEKGHRQLTPDLALEIADIVYYTSQPNCPDWLNNPEPFITQGLGVDMETAYAFCIVKYFVRHHLGIPTDKKIEKEVMEQFLKVSPILQNNSPNFIS